MQRSCSSNYIRHIHHAFIIIFEARHTGCCYGHAPRLVRSPLHGTSFGWFVFLSSLPILAHSIPGLYPSSARGRQISPSLSIGARARLMKIGYYTFAELCSYNNRFLSYIQNFSPFLMGSNPPTDSSKPASVDQFWKIFADIKETDVNCTDMNRKGVSKGGGGSAVLTVLGEIVELTWSEDEEKRRVAGTHLQLFRERLSEKVHSTIPKGIVGGFECSALQINLKKWHGRPRTYVCEC